MLFKKCILLSYLLRLSPLCFRNLLLFVVKNKNNKAWKLIMRKKHNFNIQDLKRVEFFAFLYIYIYVCVCVCLVAEKWYVLAFIWCVVVFIFISFIYLFIVMVLWLLEDLWYIWLGFVHNDGVPAMERERERERKRWSDLRLTSINMMVWSVHRSGSFLTSI